MGPICKKLNETNAGAKIMYSLEIGVELSLKALPVYHGIDFPKTHNVLSAVVSLVTSEDFNDLENKGNSEFIFSTFHALLDLRGASGYSYESSYCRQFFLEKGRQHAEHAERILEMVRKHILASGN